MKKAHVLAVFALLAAVLLVPRSGLCAQEGEKAPAARQETPENKTAEQKHAAASHESEQEEKKEAREEESSPAVRGLAKVTGLSPHQVYWGSVILNFAIVAFLIVFGLVKKLPGAFRARTSAIQAGMEEARKSSEAARQRLAEVEARLSRLDVEIATMRSEAEDMGRAEEKRIQSESEAERKRIVAGAEQEIAAAAGVARRDLKAYAAELAVDLAAKKIRVEKGTDQALVSEFTVGFGKDGN